MRVFIELPTWLGDAVMASGAIENLSKNAEAGANKNSCENLGVGEQSHENLDKNSSEANSSAKILF